MVSRNESTVALWKLTESEKSPKGQWLNDCNLSKHSKQALQSQLPQSGGTTQAVTLDPDTMEARLLEPTEAVLLLTA